MSPAFVYLWMVICSAQNILIRYVDVMVKHIIMNVKHSEQVNRLPVEAYVKKRHVAGDMQAYFALKVTGANMKIRSAKKIASFLIKKVLNALVGVCLMKDSAVIHLTLH